MKAADVMSGFYGIFVAGMAVVLLTGCTTGSTYQMYYHKAMADNQELKTEVRKKSEEILRMGEEITELQTRVELSKEVLEQQKTESDTEEARKQTLLNRLQLAIAQTPSEAIRRGDKYVVITRFSFQPGEASLDVRARADLQKIAAALTEPFPDATYLVAGHADSTPIRESRFRSNRELSGQRALAVMEYLVSECRIPEDKIAYAGYGEFYPIADNATAEGRERNRRIEIIVTPE